MELETLYLKKSGTNSGHILFDDANKVRGFKSSLKKLNIRHVIVIVKSDNKKYFVFQLFGIRKKLLKICSELREVLK